MIIPINEEKAFDKVQHQFMIKKKNSQESRFKGNIPQHNKDHTLKTNSQHHTQW